MMKICVQTGDFAAGAECALLEAAGGGGVSSFVGLVRTDDGVQAMTLEHYPGMTERALAAIASTAERRWPLLAVTVIHRVGRLLPGDRIVFVGTASRHRRAALEACAFIIDQLKTAAPFWKKEELADGSARWVVQLDADDTAARRWAGEPE